MGSKFTMVEECGKGTEKKKSNLCRFFAEAWDQPETPQVKCPRRLGTSIIIQLTCWTLNVQNVFIYFYWVTVNDIYI